MASRPFLQRLARAIVDLGGDDWVFDQIADGRSIKSITDQLPGPPDRSQLYRWRDIPAHREERRAAWAAAKVQSADSRLEDGELILEDLAAKEIFSSQEVQLATSRANYKSAMAKMANPLYGDKQASGGQTINIGELHIGALRKHGSPASLPAPPVGLITEADYEVEDDRDTD
tara:strand:+ start:98 stop:616 length:519 start_codon:yes stop_codon:yes gene_type:complete